MSFSFALWLRVRRGYDVLHVKDPVVARVLDAAHRAGLSGARVVLANGTDEAVADLSRMTHLQELIPGAALAWETRPERPRTVHAIPNFIDVAAFAPGDKAAARRRLGFPDAPLIVLSCAAIRRVHKRADYLIREFASMTDRPGLSGQWPLLVVAGGREVETDGLAVDGKALLGERVRFLVDVPRSRMADLYQSLFDYAAMYSRR